ncbi:MAG: hypothetical protein RAM36_06535 [Arsenophonus sp.]|nr:hypothetical protein [Arsenophonus sp.]
MLQELQKTPIVVQMRGVIAEQNNFLSAKDVMDMKKELEEADKSRTDKQVIYQNPIYSTNYY